jgi:thiol-disulfide isomerase/thioredoxin
MKTLLALGLWMGMLLGAQGGERQAVFAGLEVAKHLHGDEVTPEDLVGQVVFLEYWGVRCPPCRASFPHLVAMQKKHGGSGKFTVLASHVQDGTEAAADFCREQGANFPVYQQLRLAATKGTDAKATEAGEMVAAIEAYLVAEQARLSTLVNDRPARAYLDLQDLRRAIAGLEGEKEVAALATDLQRNPAVVRLAGLLKKADEIQGKIKAKPSRVLTQQLAQIRKQIKGVGDTDATSVGAEAKMAAEALPE